MNNLRQHLAQALRQRSFLIALGLLVIVVAVWGVTTARAAQPKTLDQRTYEVASQLQCPVCHGESVADAPSPLAQEMRSLIREQLSQGMSEQQVIQYFHDRYGDEILESPPASGFTALIWLGPLLMLLLGFFLLVSLVREWRSQTPLALARAQVKDERVVNYATVAPGESTLILSAAERARYRQLLRQELAAEEGYNLNFSDDQPDAMKDGEA